MITVIPHSVAYTAQCYELAKTMHAESKYDNGKVFDDARTKAMVRWLVKEPDDYYAATFLACNAWGEVIGFIAVEATPYFFSKGRFAAEIVFYVKKAHRMTTAPLQLIQAAEAWSKSVDADSIQLGAMAAHDPDRIIEFYTKIGYLPWGRVARKEL